MNNFIISILFLSIGLSVGANSPNGDKKYNLNIFQQIDLENVWFQAGNVAGLKQMPSFFPSEIKLNYNQSKGNFHSIFNGESNQSYNFSSRSFQRIRNTIFYGSFNYSKSFERNLNYSNTNEPAINYPYLLADTIGNDTYDREFFCIKGSIASVLSGNFDWGLDVDYQVGIASQNRDPRPENKVMRGKISPGIIYKHKYFKFGANLFYDYYNEDIDVSVVQEGIQYTLFQLHGPGTFIYHSSSSFYRLYQQNQFGGGFQVQFRKNKASDILFSGYQYFKQTVDDGRGGDMATWAVVKNDSKMEGINWNVGNIISIDMGEKLHLLSAQVRITKKLGTEFIQRLENIGVTNLESWITYAKERKYNSLNINAKLKYQLMTKDENNQMKSLFQVGLNYYSFQEEYHIPNQQMDHSTLVFESSFQKLFSLRNSKISAEIKLSYRNKVDSKVYLETTNNLIDKIYLPEFNFMTKAYISPGFVIGYQFPVKKLSGNYFINADFNWFHSVNNLNRGNLSFSTGFIF